MGDEHDRGSRLIAQVTQQVEDLCLDGDVESGRRLVGDDELGTEGERHGDDDALLLSTGELVRVVIEAALRIGDPDLLHGGDDLGLEFGLARTPVVGAQAFGDLPSHRVDGVECRRWLLEHHRHICSAHLAQLFPGDAEDVLSGDDDCTRSLGGLGQEPEDGACGHGLARAGFAHDREHFARSH